MRAVVLLFHCFLTFLSPQGTSMPSTAGQPLQLMRINGQEVTRFLCWIQQQLTSAASLRALTGMRVAGSGECSRWGGDQGTYQYR